MEHKYIRHSSAGFIVWPVASGEFWHKHVKAALDKFMESGHVVSAGLCWFDKHGAHCHGESESTGIRSKPEDSELLSKQMGFK